MNTSSRIGRRRYEATTRQASRQAERWRPGQSERLATSGDGGDGFFSRARHQPCSHIGDSLLSRYQHGAPALFPCRELYVSTLPIWDTTQLEHGNSCSRALTIVLLGTFVRKCSESRLVFFQGIFVAKVAIIHWKHCCSQITN
jgi:hypothetical protein